MNFFTQVYDPIFEMQPGEQHPTLFVRLNQPNPSPDFNFSCEAGAAQPMRRG